MSTLNLTIAEVGLLVGDSARSNILAVLMDGRALTAKELAFIAGVTPQTASGHLSKLTAANFLVMEKQGRHRYFRLASPLIGRMLEGIMAVAALQIPPRRSPPSRISDEMRIARTCYDHIAGRLGVGLADALVGRDHVLLGEDGGEVTDTGADFLNSFGVRLSNRKLLKRAFCRPCLDWSERRPHIAGAVGAALCERCLELGWIERRRDTRSLSISDDGRRGFLETFGIDLYISGIGDEKIA